MQIFADICKYGLNVKTACHKYALSWPHFFGKYSPAVWAESVSQSVSLSVGSFCRVTGRFALYVRGMQIHRKSTA